MRERCREGEKKRWMGNREGDEPESHWYGIERKFFSCRASLSFNPTTFPKTGRTLYTTTVATQPNITIMMSQSSHLLADNCSNYQQNELAQAPNTPPAFPSLRHRRQKHTSESLRYREHKYQTPRQPSLLFVIDGSGIPLAVSTL